MTRPRQRPCKRMGFGNEGTSKYKSLCQVQEQFLERTPAFLLIKCYWWASQGTVVKNPPANVEDAGDASLIPKSGRSPGGGNGNPLQYSCLGNPMERGDWQATVHGVAKSHARKFLLISLGMCYLRQSWIPYTSLASAEYLTRHLQQTLCQFSLF